jgi:GGDEF domain-containing protein/tetratricopeptide (TPR) repeat protein
MPDISKHLEKAERLLQKGKSKDALREYLQVLEENPEHELAALAAAELHLSLGYDRQAANLLVGIFDRQAAQGQRPQAIITYRKLLKISNLTPERSLQAARFLESANRRESLDAYQSALQGFKSSGRTADALAAMRGIVAQDPAIENLRQLGELAVAAGEAQESSAAFLRAGNLVAKDPNYSESSLLELYERAHTVYPEDGTAAIAYARTLLQKETPERTATASRVLQPFAQGPAATQESGALYGRALLATGFHREAEPFLWQMFLQDPGQGGYVVRVIEAMLAHEQIRDAVQLARRLEQQQQRTGRLRDHAAAMSLLAEKYPASTEFLEYLLELFNLANREADYCQTLLRLFELYYAAGNFLKASDCLDRAAEVDPYVPGHKKRLQLLHGKVDESRLRNVATRLQGALTAPTKPEATAEEAAPPEAEALAGEEPTVLEDLILQAEIFMQYSLRPRAVERVERIRALFPGEELKNERLRELYSGLGLFVPPPAASPAAGVAANEAAADDIARVTGITRNIYRQGSVKAVLFAAVNEIGRHWRASRCVAMLRSPGKPPTMALEYCGAGVERFNVHAIVKLVGILQPLLIAHGPLTVQEGMNLPSLAPLKQFAAGMGINSLITVPLIEGEEHIGLVLLAQCGAGRKWLSSDTVVLKNIADQIVQALSNARLRGLVKNLAVKEEKSGLVKRSSYLDVLIAEVSRGLQQNAKLSVVLLNFGKVSELVRQAGAPAMEQMFEQIGQLISSRTRQTDLGVRYDVATVALILPDTDEKSALLVVEKFRGLLESVPAPGGAALALTAGVAEATMHSRFDPVDVVTEVINRVEAALDAALAGGGNGVQALAPEVAVSATS